MALKGGSSGADGAQSRWVGEYGVEVINWVVIDLEAVRMVKGGILTELNIPASREDGAVDTPFILPIYAFVNSESVDSSDD